jgi:carbamoyltransferase
VYGWIAAAGPLAPRGTLRSCEVPPERESDLAASAQAMFEQAMLATVEAAERIARNAGFQYETIVLGGGCALNCPANSLIHRRFGKRVFIPPAVNDEGIGAGAALALHSLLGKQPARGARRSMGQIAYKGKAYAVTRAQLEPFLGELEIVSTDAPAAHLARAIREGAIAGLFEKGAEIGPRALGHRSLVGSPLIAGNWAKLNRFKGRELWRPVAPIALPEDAARHFDGIPGDSYYMLFNARARTRELPAVTHIDGTARVQIAHPDNGFVCELLGRFKELSGFGVLINTSFNGRDEPIVETPEDALRAFLRMRVDFLYLDGILLQRRQSA